MNINYRTDHGILSVEPTGALSAADFQALGRAIDETSQKSRDFAGILIHTKDFPGYESASDALEHAKFLRKNSGKVGKVALCTDSSVTKLGTMLGQAFTDATVKKFDYAQRDEAEKWLLA